MTGLVTLRSALRCLIYFTGAAWTDFDDLICIPLARGFSATWTAPPASNAPPAAVADNFARAIFTDMSKLSCYILQDPCRQRRTRPPALPCQRNRRQYPVAGNRINHEKRAWSRIFARRIGRFGQAVPQWNQTGRKPFAVRVQFQDLPSNSPDWRFASSPAWPVGGGIMSRCCHARSFRHRPRAVRAIRPSWIR